MGALSAVEERTFRIREIDGSNPSVSNFWYPTGWPSGLRRQTQVLVSSEARVRTPLLSYLTGRRREKHRSRQDSNLQPLDPRSNALPLSHATMCEAKTGTSRLRGGAASQKSSDEGGVRTHASEEIAALTQRLRPLGHLATHPASKVHPLGFEPRTFAVLKRRHNQLDHGCPSCQKALEMQGIDPCTSRMLSERSTI